MSDPLLLARIPVNRSCNVTGRSGPSTRSGSRETRSVALVVIAFLFLPAVPRSNSGL